MMWDLPISVIIDGTKHEIENKCDYRVVLDCISVYEDVELDISQKHQLAMFIFYKNPQKIKNIEEAVKQMLNIISGQKSNTNQYFKNNKFDDSTRYMSWQHDFAFIAPPVSRVLGYDVRTPNKYTHWWSFLGAYMEIGECTWSTFISIRIKKINGYKLEKWEERIYKENKEHIDLKQELSFDELEYLYSD